MCGALFQLAIEKAGSIDRDKVRDALAKLDVVTFWGPVKFGANGQINSLEPPVFQIQGGKPSCCSRQRSSRATSSSA